MKRTSTQLEYLFRHKLDRRQLPSTSRATITSLHSQFRGQGSRMNQGGVTYLKSQPAISSRIAAMYVNLDFIETFQKKQNTIE